MKSFKKPAGSQLSRFIALALLAVVVIWIVSGQLLASNNTAEKDNSPTPKPAKTAISNVRTELSEAQTIEETYQLYGTTAALRKVILHARINGVVQTLAVNDGDMVKEGDAILKLDIEDRQAALQKGEAELAQRLNDYKNTQTRINAGYQSKTTNAEALTALRTAEAQLATLKQAVTHSTITAPFSGQLQHFEVEKGDSVRAQETAIATLIDTSEYLLVAHVPEMIIQKVKKGNLAQATLRNGQKVEGTVSYVGNVADPVTRSFRIEAIVPGTGRIIPDGMTAEIILSLGDVKAHKIESSSLALNEDGAIGVKLLNSDHLVEFLPLHIVSETADGMWVSGLPDQAQIITIGQAFLQTGDRVNTGE